MVAVIANTCGALRHYFDGDKQKSKQAIMASFLYGWRGLRFNLMVVIFLLLIEMSVTILWESDRFDHYNESIKCAEVAIRIGDSYRGELPSDYADVALMRQMLDRALASAEDVQILGAEQLPDCQSRTAFERLFVGGLWDIYVGIIEADTSRYQLGSAELREWFTWLDGKETVESDVLLGVSMSNHDIHR